MGHILSIWFPHFTLERHWKAKRHMARFGGERDESGGENGLATAANLAAKAFVLVEHGVLGTGIKPSILRPEPAQMKVPWHPPPEYAARQTR